MAEPFRSALVAAGYRNIEELPIGRVIAVVHVSDCLSTNVWQPPEDSNEFQFGNYAPDRFAIRLDGATRIKPFEAKGSLGIWRLPRPITADDVMEQAA